MGQLKEILFNKKSLYISPVRVISSWARYNWMGFFYPIWNLHLNYQANIDVFLTFMLCNFLVWTLQYLKKHPMKTLKSSPHRFYGPVWNFQYCQLAQNQPKSHILFNKNVSPRDLYKLTLILHQVTKVASWSSNTNNAEFLFLLWKL